MPERNASSRRLARVRTLMRQKRLDALLVLDLKNIRYLSGFSGSDGALLIGGGQPVLLVDGRYATQAAGQAPDCRVIVYQEKVAGIREAIRKTAEILGFEPAAVSVELFGRLRKSLKGVRWTPLQEELGSLRAIKDPDEIRRIRKAIRIAATSLQDVIASIRPGVAERDIALQLEHAMRRNGAEKPSFDSIIASGPNGALPHARPGRRKLKRGDLVVIDYGAVFQGYHSDETCTFAVGRAGRKQREIYALVKEAHDRAIEAIRPGVACREIDSAARGLIERAGYGSCFNHGTGHGIGLDVHEAPRVSGLSESVLREGMVVTVEPGIYIPGFGGVRIEDSVLVERAGARVLTLTSKELQILG